MSAAEKPVVPFGEARPFHDSFVWDWPGDEYAWVTETDHFEDGDFYEPIEVRRRRWMLVEETTMIFTPPGMLCAECKGEGEIEVDYTTKDHPVIEQCSRCGGDGRDPDAGTWKPKEESDGLDV